MANYIKDKVEKKTWKRGVQSPFPETALVNGIAERMRSHRYQPGESFYVTFSARLCQRFGYEHKDAKNLQRNVRNFFVGRDGKSGWVKEQGLRWTVKRDGEDKDGNRILKFTRYAGVTSVMTEKGLKTAV